MRKLDSPAHSEDGGDGGEKPPKVSRKVAAEAAMWVARLHGPSRSRQMELDCMAWQQKSEAHRHAFERITQVWMEVPNIDPAALHRPRPKQGLFRRIVASWNEWTALAWWSNWAILGGVVAVALAATAWQQWPAGDGYRTAVGETQTALLADGSRLSLNTDTRVRVVFDAGQRLVAVQGGEVAFEVAKDAKRPFIVRAAGSEVVALGTVFAVRLEQEPHVGAASLAVTLVEGQVSVRAAAGSGDAGGRAGPDGVRLAPAQPLVMHAGDRVRLQRAAGDAGRLVQQVDRPPLDQVMAWRRNEAVFNQATLADAVAEMNRYSATPIVLVGDLGQADWRVTGQFRTGDSEGFATALAAIHGLVVRERQGRLELLRP